MRHAILDELLEAARSGDRSRFDRLFDVWLGAVYALILRRVGGDRQRAEARTRRVLVACMRVALSNREVDARPEESEESTKARGEPVELH